MQEDFQRFNCQKKIDHLLIWSGLLILLIGSFSHIDIMIADTMFDQADGQFMLPASRLAEASGYQSFQYMLAACAFAAMVLAAWDAWRPRSQLAPYRVALRVTAGSAILIPSAITLFSLLTETVCPLDLQRYGGAEVYTRLLDDAPTKVAATSCPPVRVAGHGWWILAVAVFWIPKSPRLAVSIGAMLFFCGLLAACVKQMQGVQFFSQTLWSAWIASYLVYFLYHLFTPDQAQSDTPLGSKEAG